LNWHIYEKILCLYGKSLITMIKPFKTETNNYTLYGALFGLLFPIVATTIEGINKHSSLTWEIILQVQSENVLLWIIDSAPFFLGLFARLGGIRQDSLLMKQQLVVPGDDAEIPVTSLVASCCFFMALVGGTSWYAWHSFDENRKIFSKKSEFEQLSGDIVYFDEILTMSARLFTLTMNPDWEKRYKEYETKLDSVINKAKDLASKELVLSFIQQTDESNQELIILELMAFNLAREGKVDKAKSILFGNRYLDKKNNYSEGVRKFLKEAEIDFSNQAEASKKLLIMVGVGCFLLMFFNVFVLTIVLVKYYLKNKATKDILTKTHFELERKFKERSIDIVRAKDEAEKANQHKNEFLSEMSHELRTPLNAIMGFSQLVLMRPDNLTITQKNNVKTIESSGKHLLELVNEILDLSKIESGELKLSIEPIDITILIEEVLEFSKGLCQDYKVSKIDFQKSSSFWVLGDRTRLKQILLNLLSNAIKYNKKGGSVLLSVNEKDDKVVLIEIRDTGIGISENMKHLVFEPFNRLGLDYSVTSGTGIGLSITKQLVEKMNGKVYFESKLGQGSTFYVEMPLCDPKNIERFDNNEINKVLSSELSTPFIIIYVDDNFSNLEVVKQVISRRKNIRLITSSQALEGIELAKIEKPDLILMDIQMPKMGGREAFKVLQGDSRTKDIPVVALSADALKSDIDQTLSLGFKSYITKPLDMPKFLEEIDRFVEKRDKAY
jgi:signal transduction histidine kinase/CheY-like chemotaxis protein